VSNWIGLIEFSASDLLFVAFAVQQYVSISRDIKRTKAKEKAEAQRDVPPASS
jgi:hypothetical protein